MTFTKSFCPAFFKNPKLAYLNFSRERMEKANSRLVKKLKRTGVSFKNTKIRLFKITSNKYRNRRKRFGLRMSIICGIISFENCI